MVNPAAAAARRSRKAQAKKRHVAKRMDKLKVLRGGEGKGWKRVWEALVRCGGECSEGEGAWEW